ncbi:MAG: glycosyltransferase family 4 protein [Candidatus Promineifilaceae bacterium]
MKILYLSSSYVPSRRASSIQVMRMCEALAQQGHQVTVVVKANADRREGTTSDDHAFYGVAPVFEIKKISRPSFKGGGILYTTGIWRVIWARRSKVDIVYSRDIPGGRIAAMLGCSLIFEAHGVPSTPALRRQFKKIIDSPTFRRLIVISQGLKDDLAAHNLLPAEDKVLVLHDGASPILTGTLPVKAIRQLNGRLPNGRSLHIGYVGQLYQGKGMEVILPLARKMPEACFHIVGGEEKDLQRWQGQNPPDNLTFHGFVSPGELGALYEQFDILLLPPQQEVYGATHQSEISRWMSPMKMFEYMSAGKPIISSDLPVLKEVLAHERNALLVPPGAVNDWVEAIKRLRSDAGLAEKLSEQARQDFIDNYTWSARATKALAGL